MIIIHESKKSTIKENTKVNLSRWTSGLKNLSTFMYGFLLRIEREGFWERNDAPRTYRDMNVVAHNNGNVEVYNNEGHFGCAFKMQSYEISLLYKELPRLGITVGD